MGAGCVCEAGRGLSRELERGGLDSRRSDWMIRQTMTMSQKLAMSKT